MMLTRLLGGVTSLRTREVEAATYELRLPSLPTKSVSAEKERVELIEALRDQFARSLLWINELNEDLRATEPLASADSDGGWCGLMGVSVDELLSQLYRGGWGMFFLDVEETPTRPQLLPVEPGDLRRLLREISRRGVGIVSWYDNRTWIAVEVGDAV